MLITRYNNAKNQIDRNCLREYLWDVMTRISLGDSALKTDEVENLINSLTKKIAESEKKCNLLDAQLGYENIEKVLNQYSVQYQRNFNTSAFRATAAKGEVVFALYEYAMGRAKYYMEEPAQAPAKVAANVKVEAQQAPAVALSEAIKKSLLSYSKLVPGPDSTQVENETFVKKIEDFYNYMLPDTFKQGSIAAKFKALEDQRNTRASFSNEKYWQDRVDIAFDLLEKLQLAVFPRPRRK